MLFIDPKVKAHLALEMAISTGVCEIEIPVEDESLSSHSIKVSKLIVKLERVTLDNGVVRVVRKIVRVVLDAKTWFEGAHYTA
jgi:hypothetical protein